MVLPNHHPQWANASNSTGLVPQNLPLERITLVLSRSPEQEQAFESFLANQQNPASLDYHHWLTPAEVGDRFGLSEADIATITGWLQSQGLHVNWVSPSRLFIGFGGTAANVGRAFQTELHNYKVDGVERMSVSSDPTIPQALVPAIKSIRGLYTIPEHPMHSMAAPRTAMPDANSSNGEHFLAPADFAAIYNIPPGSTGAQFTIGIVSWSRTDFADFDNFRQKTGNYFSNPTEVVPTAFGGIDPGPAYTSPPAATVDLSGQVEATLDVLRAGSVAPGANLLLVASPSSATSSGIGEDAQYMVQTTPVPVQVMTISFGDCESSGGPAGVQYWDQLFQQAASEGISVFVSSGDSGAAGCDAAFVVPPAPPIANSPNYICSSSYATCVGGTEFNDTANPSAYWSSSNSSTLQSAFGYIPEGGWNESWVGLTSMIAASGGGVSKVIATPSWQTGTGVPAARSGRYTPDVSFSSSMHDGYFGCFAAGGASCVSSSTGSYTFTAFAGTSAAAPSMAGVAALLNLKLGSPQGNLNPEIYREAATTPAAFHDVTVATAGLNICLLSTPSMCNNSIAGPINLTGNQPGYAVNAGYDEVTGLGSLDITTFLNNYVEIKTTPTLTVTLSSSAITTAQELTVTVTVNGLSYYTPMGTITLSGGGYSASQDLFYGVATFRIPALSLAVGKDTLTLNFAPPVGASTTYNPASATSSVTVTAAPKVTPTVAVTPSSSTITTAQGLVVTIAVSGPAGYTTPTGTVSLTRGSYSSGPVALTVGSAIVNILADSLASGTDALRVSYTPDAAVSPFYNSASGSSSLTVTALAKITPAVLVQPNSSVTIFDAYSVSVTVDGGPGNQPPTGTVKLTSGTFNTSITLPPNGSGLINFAAGSLPIGTDLMTVVYTPDAQSANIYNSATGTGTETVTKFKPAFFLSLSAFNITTAQPLTVWVTVVGPSSITGTVVLTSGSYTSAAYTLQSAYATIIVPAGALPVGTDRLTLTYTPDAASSSNYIGASQTASVTVIGVALITPTITVMPSSSSIVSTSALPITITVNGGAGNATPTGSVTLVSGTYVSPATSIAGGSATINIPAGALAVGADTLSGTYTPDAASSTIYKGASGSGAVTITAPPPPSFTIKGAAVTVFAGATTGNTSTITVAPVGGFTGSVALTAAVTSSPAGAVHPPTFSFAPSPVPIAGGSNGTATLTISTTAATTTAMAHPDRRGAPWRAAGGAALACILLFGIPARRRNWRNMLGMLVLLALLGGGMLACGGSGGNAGGGGGGGTSIPGTTAGSYTVTVTGAAGTETETCTVNLTVQ
jgi:subtilase family serine protease